MNEGNTAVQSPKEVLRKRVILVIALLSYFLTTLDNAVVITGLERIAEELSLSQTVLSWVQGSYVLAFGGFILFGGRLGDVIGRRKTLMLALTLFGIASAIVGVTSSVPLILGARFLQGAGAGVLAPTTLALIMDTFEGEARVKAVAWYGSISGLGSCFGLVIGGVLAEMASWRDGFFLNIPVVIVMLILTAWAVRPTRLAKGTFDVLGTVLSIVGIFAAVYAINGALHPWPWAALAAVLLGTFLWVERRTSLPIVPLGLFRDRTRACAYLARALFTAPMFGFWFFVSEAWQEGFHFGPTLTGLAFLPMTFCTFLAAIAVPPMIARQGDRRVLFLGEGCLVFGMLLLATCATRMPWVAGMLPATILLGFGQGFTMSPLTNLGIRGTRPDEAGAASGLVNVAHQMGGSFGIATMVAAGGVASGIFPAFRAAMWAGLTIIAGMVIISLFFPSDFPSSTRKDSL